MKEANIMKKSFCFTLAVIIAITAILFVGCSSNSSDKTVTEESTDTIETEEETTVEETTEEPTTESTDTQKDIIETGVWVKYSPQASLFETFEFSDGIIERKQYSYENGSVEEHDPEFNNTFMTYEVDDDTLTLADDSNKEWVWSFTDDADILERTYEESVGTDTFTVTEKMYHYDSLPSYKTVKKDSQKRGQ